MRGIPSGHWHAPDAGTGTPDRQIHADAARFCKSRGALRSRSRFSGTSCRIEATDAANSKGNFEQLGLDARGCARRNRESGKKASTWSDERLRTKCPTRGLTPSRFPGVLRECQAKRRGFDREPFDSVDASSSTEGYYLTRTRRFPKWATNGSKIESCKCRRCS